MLKIKDKEDSQDMVMLYDTLIMPLLSYIGEIWGTINVSCLHELNVLLVYGYFFVCENNK